MIENLLLAIREQEVLAYFSEGTEVDRTNVSYAGQWSEVAAYKLDHRIETHEDFAHMSTLAGRLAEDGRRFTPTCHVCHCFVRDRSGWYILKSHADLLETEPL